jgi:outer membrane protein
MSNRLIFGLYGLLSISVLFASEPLTLSNAYDLALKNEPRLKSASLKAMANAESIDQVTSRLYPQLQGSASWGRYEYDAQYLHTPVKEDYTDYSISASQAIYHPEYWRGIDQARTKQSATTFQYQAQAQQLGLDLTKAYFLVLRDMKNVELAFSQKEFYGQKYKQLEEMLKFGLSNRIDLLETKIQRDKATSQWLTEQKHTQVAKLRLEYLIGEKIDQLNTFDFDSIDTTKLSMERNEWEDKISQNPSTKASQLVAQAAHDEIAIRNYEHYPKVDLSLNRKETNSADPVAHSYDNQAILRVSVPLYQGGYTQSRVREAMLLLDSAQKEQEYYKQEATARFEEAWQERQFAIENFNNLKESKKSAELYMQSIEKAHEAGLKSVVDVLESKAKVYEIQRDLVDAGYELVNNHLTLLDVTGELNVETIEKYEKALH